MVRSYSRPGRSVGAAQSRPGCRKGQVGLGHPGRQKLGSVVPTLFAATSRCWDQSRTPGDDPALDDAARQRAYRSGLGGTGSFLKRSSYGCR